MLNDDSSLYTAGEIVDLEAAFRADDPEELERIYAKWRDRAPRLVEKPKQLPDCEDCRIGHLPQCSKHPYVGDA